MDLRDTLKFIEDYAKSYVQYMLSFVGSVDPQPATPAGSKTPKSKAAALPPVDDGNLFTFGFLNAVIGATLQWLFMHDLAFGLFAGNAAFGDVAFAQVVIVELCYWLLLSIILHTAINFRDGKAHFSQSLTVILKVVPIAYVLSSYGAYVGYFIALGLASGAHAPWFGAVAYVLAHWLLLTRFLPRAAARITEAPPRQQRRAAWCVIGVVIAVQTLLLLATMPEDFVRVLRDWAAVP